MKNNKALGQHWLKNRVLLDEIADIANFDTANGTWCIEIGPGLGTLTSSLIKRFEKVIAIEFDERLAGNLPKSFPGTTLEVIQGDILKIDVAQHIEQHPYVVAGNIPYYITSPIVHKMLSLDPRPQKIVLLMQKEVAERIAAEKGKHTVLSLMVQNLAAVELGPVVKAIEFTPPPKVDSQVITLVPREEPQIAPEIFTLIKQGFLNPRKKLVHNLAGFKNHSKEDWQKYMAPKINPNARAGELSLNDWEFLSRF